MDRLRRLLSSINAQLSVLSVSQRLAIGLCAALVAASLLWLLQWSATPNLVPALGHDLTFEELDAAEEALRAEGLTFETRGMRVYVRRGDRHNALRLLHSAGALPEGTLFDMAAVVTDSNPFQSPEARAYAQNYATGNELAKIIATYPFVKSASVLINPAKRRRLGGEAEMPTASVAITLRASEEMTPEVVEGFARLVSGAVAGLKPQNVTVTDSRSGRSFTMPHPDDPTSFDRLAIQKKYETHFLSKILDKLAYIPGVMASVTVELDARKRTRQTFVHDDPAPKTDRSRSSDQRNSAPAAEPGVQPNLGVAVTAGAGGQNSTSEETEVENFPPQLKETETVEHVPFGVSSVTATVSIPRSFIVGVYQARRSESASSQGSDTAPGSAPPAAAGSNPSDDDPQFAAVRDEQVAMVQAGVEKIVMARSPSDVQVDVYPDMEWSVEGGAWSRAPGSVALAQAGGDALDPLGMLQSYGPPAGLGFLALMSLLMLSRIVRKSGAHVASRRANIPDLDLPPEDAAVLTVGPYPIGQAEATGAVLSGKEVEPETLRFQELGQEVSRMVQEDPRSSADLIRRWLQEDSRG